MVAIYARTSLAVGGCTATMTRRVSAFTTNNGVCKTVRIDARGVYNVSLKQGRVSGHGRATETVIAKRDTRVRNVFVLIK